jgi:hypothetical protein
MLYAFDASREYDPSKDLEKITAPVLAINSADDVVNPPELGLMEKLMPRVKHGRYVLISTSDETRGHGTHSLPAVWGGYLEELLKTLTPSPLPTPPFPPHRERGKTETESKVVDRFSPSSPGEGGREGSGEEGRGGEGP